MPRTEANRLLESLVADPAFRAQFERDPEGTARLLGFEQLADSLAAEDDAPVQGLEHRESRSSLAGALLAAAAEGIGLFQLIGHSAPVGSFGVQDAEAANGSSSSHLWNADQFGAKGTGGPPTPELQALLHNGNVAFDSAGIADLQAGRIDPRVVDLLTELSQHHRLTISSMLSDHPEYTSGGSVSNHYYGRAFDIATVDGKPVDASNQAAHQLALDLAKVDPSVRPTEIGSPWALPGAAYFTNAEHQNHVHVGFDNPIAPNWQPPAGDAAAVPAAAAPAAAAPAAAAPAPAPPPAAAAPAAAVADNTSGGSSSDDTSDGNSGDDGISSDDTSDGNSGNDGSSSDGGDDSSGDDNSGDDSSDNSSDDSSDNSGDDNSDSGADAPGEGSNGEDANDDSGGSNNAVTDGTTNNAPSNGPSNAPSSNTPSSAAGDNAGSSSSADSSGSSGSSDVASNAGTPATGADLAHVADTYPGDDASREQIAAWLGAAAKARGLPPELPVMAGLVESGLSNLNHGDADSLGLFQMRTSVWNSGPYAGYPQRPELQVQWFLDHAVAVRAQRVAAGLPVDDPKQYGQWIADIERPADQYRGRYQLRLDQARELLAHPGANAAAPANQAQVFKAVDPKAVAAPPEP